MVNPVIFFVLICILLIGLVYLLNFILLYLTPFVIAVLLAGFIDPLVNFLEQRMVVSRGLVVFLVLFFLVLLFIIFIIFGLARVYLELEQLIVYLPEDYESLQRQLSWILEQNHQLQRLMKTYDLPEVLNQILEINLPLLYDGLNRGLLYFVNSLFNILSKLPLLIIILFVGMIATFFVSRDKFFLSNFILQFFSAETKKKLLVFRDELINSALGYIRARLVLIFLSGIIATVGLFLAGSSFSFSLGLFCGLLDLIPVLGPALIFYPLVLYNLLSGSVLTAVYFLFIHFLLVILRSGLEGKIVGYSLGIHPLAAMIALYLGYRFSGFYGLLLAPGILIIIKSLYKVKLTSAGE